MNASLDVIMIHNACEIVGSNMTDVQSIALVMKSVLMVAQRLSMDIHVTLGFVKAIL